MHGQKAEVSFLGVDSYLYKSEYFVLTFYVVWLLVRAVTGGAGNGYGKNKQPFPRAFSPNK
jgi:hypothetical protein